MSIISVLGFGAWGATVAQILLSNGHEVRCWSHSDTSRDLYMFRKRHKGLGQTRLKAGLLVSCDPKEVLVNSDAVVVALPSKYLDLISQWQSFIPEGVPVLSLTKGLNNGSAGLFVSQYLTSVIPKNPIAVLSGPNLANEIIQGLPAAAVIASRDLSAAKFFQKALSCATFRTYTSDDVAGVEIGGVLKNVMAIASGVASGLGLGTNLISALVSRSLVEMKRFGTLYNARPETFMGLSGVGDLVATCTSPLSRNFRLGLEIAKGGFDIEHTSFEVLPEGARTADLLNQVAQENNIELPILEAVYAVIYSDRDPQACIAELMHRDLKAEF